MERFTFKLYFILLLNVALLTMANGQQLQQVNSGERIALFTDRTIYVAGEQILFSAFLQSGIKGNQIDSSRVMYCEIIAPDGTRIAGNKYVIEDFSSNGYLSIPDDITTGNYYLRAYTKIMRNEGPSSYHYTLLKIVNPNRTEVQALNNSDYSSDILPEEAMAGNKNDFFIISSDKQQYASRDTVHISIAPNGAGGTEYKGLSLGVVPEFSISANSVIKPESEQVTENNYFFSETRGLSITGKLTDSITGISLPGTRVNLSVIGRGKDFMAMETDAAGRFFFSLPDYTGNRDIFLCAETSGTTNPEILVDNDFCPFPVIIPSNVFTLSPEERKTAFNIAVNKQLESFFNIDSTEYTESNLPEDQAFYGKPAEILTIDNYVLLPTLEEYFNGLPTLVKVRKREGEKYFKILGTQSDLNNYEPLVLIDLVAVSDPAQVLAIPPSNISRIEVVNMLYVKGDQTYGGIINIISRRGDFAGIDLPSSGIFINYGFFASGNPESKTDPLFHIPDTRNTLFWNPRFSINQVNTSDFKFIAPDTPGKYLIVLNGINSNGETYRQIAEFEVAK